MKGFFSHGCFVPLPAHKAPAHHTTHPAPPQAHTKDVAHISHHHEPAAPVKKAAKSTPRAKRS